MDVEVQPNLEFIDEPVYIHEISEELHDFHIESESEVEVGKPVRECVEW